ncbi:MaoC family dehydratase, partial [Streptomyces coelicoflavus]|uniref:MaoC family dehydratase n=1 Tax=Streptomyces coelicoflavus TaxID=285562 RepID=UPI0036769C9A
HVLHGGQRLRLHRPAVPVRGRATASSRVVAVYDKGSAAVLVLRTEVADADGPLWTEEAEVFVRGEGGWGGERGPSGSPSPPPAEPADHVAERAVREDQALLYRLSGDWNPLHADPEFAARAGFERPVLHGLCTYGAALKAVVDTLLDGDVTRVREYRTRFAGVVYPGETLRVRMWRGPGAEGAGAGETEETGEAGEAGETWEARVAVSAVERGDAPVLADTVVRYG